jgi:hypothetical protein
MNRVFAAMLVCLSLAMTGGCDRVETLSGSELLAKARQAPGTGTTACYYKGSSDRYDFFVVEGAGGAKTYRVQPGSVPLKQRFPVTSEQGKWVVLQ